MKYWQGGFVVDILIVISLLAVAALVRRAIPRLRKFGLPDAIIAGLVGLGIGPTGLGLLDIEGSNLETVVYHGVALIFISVALQTPPPGKKNRGRASCAFAIPALAAMQGLIGLCVVLGWNAFADEPIHTGIGMILPLGFDQGPGSAMTLGAAWEQSAGMTDGAQIGLIMAAAGFGWCCVGGILIVAVGRRRGWTRRATDEASAVAGRGAPAREPAPTARFGRMEPLVAQLVTIALVYLVTYLFLDNVAPLLPEKHQPTLWSLHFVIASAFALLARRLVNKLPGGSPLNDDLLARSSSVFVEVTTTSALVAVQLTVLADWIGPILVISTLGGVITATVALWLARRAFPEAPFEHSIVLFGAMTGTTATGLALLRLVDPDFRGPAARNFVIAASAATLLAGPLLAVMPYAVLGFEDNYMTSLLVTIGILVAYSIILVVAWRRFGALRFVGPVTSFWPEVDHDAER